MKRVLVVVSVFALASTAFAATVVTRGDRVAVLRTSETDGHQDTWLRDRIRTNLTSELRTLGVDAFDARQTYTEAIAAHAAGARYALEVSSAKAANRVVPVDVAPGIVPAGAVATSPTNAVMVPDSSTTIDLEIRLYDGATLQLLRTYEVHENVTQTGPAFGVDKIWALMPFPRYVSTRSAARAAAREAALKVANVNQIE